MIATVLCRVFGHKWLYANQPWSLRMISPTAEIPEMRICQRCRTLVDGSDGMWIG